MRKRGDLVRQIKAVALRPFASVCLDCPGSEHALRRRVEEEKVFILIGDDDGIAHVGQNGAKDFVRARKLVRGAFSLYDQIQVCGYRHDHPHQLFVLAPRFAHEKFDHCDDLVAR